MRAAIFNGPHRPVTIERVDDPVPCDDEVVVRVRRCGICGSDVSLISGEFASALQPGSGFGHEYAGEVVALGRSVTTLVVGDRVACMPVAACGECEVCVGHGSVFHCASLSYEQKTHGLAEYATVRADAAIRLPMSLSFADGALVEPMACGLHACRLAAIRGGEKILVMGGGAMALAVTAWARLLGAARVVVLSRSARRQDLLRELGADSVCSFDADPTEIQQALGGAPPDVVIECIGKQGMLQRAIDHVRPRGMVVSLGMCGHQEHLSASQCTFKEIRLIFPLGWSAREFVETASAFDAGTLRPAAMVSDVVALEALPATLENLRRGGKYQKVHVAPAVLR